MLSLDWIAGFFDGEGSASVRIANNKTCKYGFQVLPEITIGQKTRPIIEAIRDRLGFGHVYRMGGGWQFVLHSRIDIGRFVLLMRKRSVLKKRQLVLLARTMRHLERDATSAGARFRGACLSKGTMRELLLIAREMRTLNRKRHRHTVDLSRLEIKLKSPL